MAKNYSKIHEKKSVAQKHVNRAKKRGAKVAKIKKTGTGKYLASIKY